MVRKFMATQISPTRISLTRVAPARTRLALASLALAGSVVAFGAFGSQADAQVVTKPAVNSPRLPERGIRRDIPLTNMIRRAFDAGTRDSTGRPGRNYWQLWTDYKINARFDPITSTVTGRETIVVKNNSNDSLSTIRVRLDQNIFAPNVPRAEEVTEITEGMKVTKIVVNGMTVDLNAPRGGRGAGGGRGGRGAAPAGPVVATATGLNTTSAVIRPGTAIAPKASATLEFEWSFRVPSADGVRGLRMGRWADTLYQVAQWYPRVAVYDDLRQGGWDDDPYLGPSEFYNNFGHFDVSIDMPAGWLVGSTGVLQNPEQVLTAEARERLSHVLESESQRTIVSASDRGPGKSTAAGDRLTWHFVADTVADVAWATSNQFQWDATRANIPGRGYIPVHFMYLAGNAGVRAGSAAAAAAAANAPAGRGNFGGAANTTCIGTPTAAPGGRGFLNQGPVARHALEFYSKLWMPYAFPQLVQVDGPEGGMEYPMFIMAAGSTDHETGHQWWPMMVGVNETWYGFMDEGFNQYMNRLSSCDARGQQPNLDGWGQQYGATNGNEREAPLMWDANYGGPNYSFQAYTKAPFMLSMLGAIVGDTTVWHAMSDYAKTWRFKHPSPWDYMFFMNHALKQDLGWFWNAWLFTNESVDGSIESVKTTGGKTAVVVREDGQMPSPVILRVELAPKGGAIAPMAGAKKVDSLTYDVTYPVNVWFAGAKTFTANLNFGTRKIEKVTFDPGRRFPDRDPCDNTWPRVTADPNAAGGAAIGGGRGGGRGGAPRC